MYTIKAFTQDGGEYWIHNPISRDLITGDPWYEVGDNINGSAQFTIYPDHPYYDKVQKLTTDIVIYKDEAEVFRGRVLYDDEDFNGSKKVYVEGELGYLCDSIQRQAVYHNISPKNYLTTILDIHNSQVEERKQFQPGLVTVEDPNDSIYRYSNYETTRETLSDKLVDRLGGHLVVRWEEETRWLDYLSDESYYSNATQTIEFGKNLLDYAKNVDATDLVTCLIPLGARLEEQVVEGLDARVTIESVNGGVDYVTDDAAVAQYGRIFATETWDDVTLPENLKTKAEDYLTTVQYENLVLELTAVDLNLTDEEIQELHVGNRVRCISEPNNLDAWYPLSKMRVYLMEFSKNKFTLGAESQNATYTSSNLQSSADMTKVIEDIPTKSEILKQAMEDATNLINGAVASGYAIHEPNEFIIADDPDYKNQAQYLWRWGAGGLAHYSNGYYGVADGIAITMDGHINGKVILAGTIMAESIDVGYTETIESEIDSALADSKKYTDGETEVVKETVSDSITNLEHRINLNVTSTKETVLQKNYVVNGESETITIDAWEISGTAATAEIAEYQNVNCLKLTFTASGIVSFTQALGTLPEGDYTVQMEAAYPDGTTRPSYIRCGFSGSYNSTYFTSQDPDLFMTVKRSFSISESSRTVYGAVYGYSGTVCYVKNIRCLRNFQELLDEVSANLTVAINEVSASVSEVYENSLYDYCVNGSFDDTSNWYDGWYLSNTEYIVSDVFSGLTCCCWTTGSSYYIRQYFDNTKYGATIKIRLKAACGSSSEGIARLRVYVNGTSQYTKAGEITSEWQTFEFTFSVTAVASVALRLYNYVADTTLYVTDVEILGYYSAYSEAQIKILSDDILEEVTRASNTEDTLRAAIDVNAEAITSCVTKNDFGTTVEQNADHVRIAWNKYTNYIQFENSALDIYDSGNTLLMALNNGGAHYYYQGNSVGLIGTNNWEGYSTHRGLLFGLEYSGGYMGWAAKESSSASAYTVKLHYQHKTTAGYAKGLHFACETYAHGFFYLTDSYRFMSYTNGSGFNGPFSFVDSSNETAVKIDGTGKSFTIYNNVAIDFYAALDMHGFAINNSSDSRLKKNIRDTDIAGLDVVNALDLKQFDWVEDGRHQDIGVIAQQVQKVAPELISEATNGTLQVAESQLVYYCIKAIQELSDALGLRNTGENRPIGVTAYDSMSDTEKEAFVSGLGGGNLTETEVVQKEITLPIRE
ncbi:MAG: phage tail protein [Bacteroidales bacterium]|nr:phage tail protein [Bacteroidales bacterium]